MNFRELGDRQLADAYAEKSRELKAIWEKGGDEFKLSKDDVDEISRLEKVLAEIVDIQKERQDLAAKKAKFEGEHGQHGGNTQMVHPDSSEEAKEKSGPRSFGELFTQSAAFKNYESAHRRGPEVTVDAKNLMNLFSGGSQEEKAILMTGDYPSVTRRLPGIQEYMRVRPVVADLLPQGSVDGMMVSFVRELVGTNGADFVEEGELKPESALGFEEDTAQVRKIATWIPVTDELMQDEPALRSVIDARLRLFLQQREEEALLRGTGTAPEFTGMYNQTGVQTQATGTDSVPDAIYRAMTKIQVNAMFQPSGVIMHPNDWLDIRLLTTADGLYIWGSPADPANNVERIWGLPVVSTAAATENTAIVGAFDVATQIFRRTGITFAVSSEHDDYFIRNQMAIRVEERLAFVIWRPAALCLVTGV